MRILYTAVFLLLTISIYGQNSTLLQNVNVRAKELKHSLNKTGDSLVLEGERTIYKVEIFNKDFEQSLVVKDSKVTIPLNNIPVGRFVVEAVLPDRLIVITLVRNEALSPAINIPNPRRKTSLFGDSPSKIVIAESIPEKEEVESKVAVINNKLDLSDKKIVETDETLAVTNETIVLANKKNSLFNKEGTTTDNTVAVNDETVVVPKKKSLFDKKETATENTLAVTDRRTVVATDKKTEVIDTEPTIIITEVTVIDINNNNNNEKLKTSKNALGNAGRRIAVSYWIVYETNNRHSSGREMRFGDKALVEKMIEHNNLDRRTKAGKFNELTIWEIYDVSKFLKYKMKHPDGFSTEADCFNTVPFYKTGNDSLTP